MNDFEYDAEGAQAELHKACFRFALSNDSIEVGEATQDEWDAAMLSLQQSMLK